jgi:two-component system sensor histidine kinase CreC
MAVRLSLRAAESMSKSVDAAVRSDVRSDVWTVPRSVRPEPTPTAFALHDAKNMMGVLLANLQVLNRALVGVSLPDGAADALDDIGESSQRLTMLLREALAGLQGNTPRRAAASPVPVGPIVTAVVDQMRPAARALGVRIVHAGQADVRATIEPALFERVVANLLENAVRFSPPHARVEVEFVARGGRMVLAVGDRGSGVAEAARDEIFESYRHRDPGGAGSHFGLGLAFCRQVARAHGGDAWVFNRSGGGACFVFEIA